jgi:hypothetical protein
MLSRKYFVKEKRIALRQRLIDDFLQFKEERDEAAGDAGGLPVGRPGWCVVALL